MSVNDKTEKKYLLEHGSYLLAHGSIMNFVSVALQET
jgi:hypothetical protein